MNEYKIDAGKSLSGRRRTFYQLTADVIFLPTIHPRQEIGEKEKPENKEQHKQLQQDNGP